MATAARAPTIEEHFFADDGHVPNNPRLPLVVYHGVLATGRDAAETCAALFLGNGWGRVWRNGVYALHHYHTTAHEVLGIAAGSVRVRLGGEGGKSVELRTGDVVVIPAGVAHKSEGASRDLVVVGAYPCGQLAHMRTSGTPDHEHQRARIAVVPLPAGDPVLGAAGPLLERRRVADLG